MGTVTLITGGSRCGKSTYALKVGEESNHQNKTFIATAEVFDDEMAERVNKHIAERGEHWKTVEVPCYLPAAITNLPEDSISIVDCLTVWLGNIWFKYGDDDKTLDDHIEELCRSLALWKTRNSGDIIIVTNEVGWGIIPPEASVRRYRDWAGKLNQKIATIADSVILCIAGIPLIIKGAKT
jgi:adenosylcobinamide kinase/adenosylcobinamide-phosphate guanylyltransferase